MRSALRSAPSVMILAAHFIAVTRRAKRIALAMTKAQAQREAQSRLKKLLAMDVAAILLAYGVERDEARRIALNAANEAGDSAGMLRLVKFRSPGVKLITNGGL